MSDWPLAEEGVYLTQLPKPPNVGDLVPCWYTESLAAEACQLLDKVAMNPGSRLNNRTGVAPVTLGTFCLEVDGGYYLNCFVTDEAYIQLEPGFIRYVDRKKAAKFLERNHRWILHRQGAGRGP